MEEDGKEREQERRSSTTNLRLRDFYTRLVSVLELDSTEGRLGLDQKGCTSINVRF